jgi:predicted MFS family arabinose efflux permease
VNHISFHCRKTHLLTPTSEKLLYGFLVPILKDMLESRLRLPPSYTQTVTTAMLTSHGLCALLSAPIIAHFADKAANRKHLLLTSLVGCVVGTLLVAGAPSGMIQRPPT